MKSSWVSSTLILVGSLALRAQPSVMVGPVQSPVNGHTYYLLSPGTWTSSQAKARSLGGNLATIRSEAEDTWLFNTFGPYARGVNNGLWVGFTDQGRAPGSFSWISGEPFSFTHWSPGEPNGQRCPVGSDCYGYPQFGQIFGPDDTRRGEWNDQHDASSFTIYGVVEFIPDVSITVTTNPPGLAIAVDGVAYTAPRTFNWPAGTPHTMSVPLQQGTGGSRFTFQSWSDGGTATHSIAALQSGTLTASFMPAYQLTTTVLPSHAGAITSSPTSSDGFFAAGSAITIAATSMLGFVFSGYSGDLSGLANPQSIAMNSPRTVTANFSCAYTITPSSTAVGSAGGNLVVTVATGAGCAWGVTNLPIWITVAAGGGGNGNGSASFSVAANTAPAPRTATFTIAGQQFMVNQAATPGCSFSLDKSSLNVLAEGASVTVSVGTSSQTCTWTAVSLDPWIVITSGAMGTGNGLATLQVFGNSASGSRSGFVNIAGQVFTINQSGTTPPTGLRFVPLRPCRLMETRPEYNFEGRIGDFGPPFMTAGTTRTLALPQSNVCSIPNTAKAFVLNVTLIPRGGVDHVTVFPGGDTRPEFYTVRSPDGQIVANSAIVKAGPGGSIQVYTTNDTDILIVEVSMNVKQSEKAIELFQKVNDVYPNFGKASFALFLQGFIYETQLNDITKAKEIYSQVVEQYPDTKIAEDAKASIANLGKSDEELIKEFEKKNKVK